MGVSSVGRQDLAALLVSTTARTPAPQPRTPEAAGREARPVEEQVQRAARSQEPSVVSQSTGRRMRIDKESHRVVAQLLNENNEVIRQIPPEEALEIAARFRRLQGMLFDERT